MYRKLALVSATVAGLLLAAPSASAQTAFDATVKNHVQRPEGCPAPSYFCGTADVAGVGEAEYRWFLRAFQPVSDTCGSYVAVVTFTRADGSRLRLDEVGTVCSPGNSFAHYPQHSYGQPQDATGEWVVRDGTGQFAGVTGDGTNTIRTVGANFRAAYTGTLDS